MFRKLTKALFGDPIEKEISELAEVADQINALESSYEAFSDDALRGKTEEFKARLAKGETLDDLLIEAFAVVREASKRSIGLRHYDIQLIGGQALHKGKIIEMRTGEGKTLVATLPIYLNALTGKGIHLITVNDFLARTQARLMAQVYNRLGMSIGVLQMASRTENGNMAFLVDLSKTSSQEDQHQLAMVPRKKAYAADITYGTNAEFGFDYLRDNLTTSLDARVQRGHHFAIIDEIDNVLIDEARTPLIISGPSQQGTEYYAEVAAAVRALNPEDYEINERDNNVTLTEIGEAHVEELLNQTLGDPERPEDITPEQARLLGFLEQALRAQFLFRRNKEYLVQGGKVIIVDEFTGRLMPGRRWSQGLHQAVEAKEGVQVEPESVTYATITLQNYFRMYDKLCGMTGTAVTEEEEFDNIYKLRVLPLLSNLEYEARRPGSELDMIQTKDEFGYKYTYYARKNDPEKKAIYFKRKDYPDIVYRSEEAKLRAIMQEIVALHVVGRPILVGTASVEHSDRLAVQLRAENISKLAQILLIRQAWVDQNNLQVIDRIVPELEPFNRPLAEIQARELREMSRSLNITNNPAEENNLTQLLSILNLQEGDRERLRAVLMGGVPNQVLNARRHDQEGLVIARAGAFGMVTIATNMAGRGVDIKLGGEIPETVYADVVRLLRKHGVDNLYDLTFDQMREALRKLPPEEYGIYQEAAEFFLESMEGDERVRELGGLHVIGSERHEARRIDNQLRGRAARQGDPGSSRFYLSLEDDLMRIFGGAQAESVFARMRVDENVPIEVGIVGRLVEQSQERVEGANFDTRKHLLEYDDVLNTQRQRIYDQRDRVFEKEELTEDVNLMLRTELEQRVPRALDDDEGPWRLLSFLGQVQPTMAFEDFYYPSFGLSLLIEDVEDTLEHEGRNFTILKRKLMKIAEDTMSAEREHLRKGLDELVKETASRHESNRADRLESLEHFFDTIEDREDAENFSTTQLADELQEVLRMPLRLSNSQTQKIKSDPEEIQEELESQLESYLGTISLRRVGGAIARRLEESFDYNPDLNAVSFDQALDGMRTAALEQYDQRFSRLLGENGAIARDIDTLFGRLADTSYERSGILQYLNTISTGQRQIFDAQSHRRGTAAYTRMRYPHLSARMIADSKADELTTRVLDHLEGAIQQQQMIWGHIEWRAFVQGQATIEQFDRNRKARLLDAFGEDWYEAHRTMIASDFPEDEATQMEAFLGHFLVNEVYRRLLLRVISDEWVEYLTKMEALRVSVAMESYAQRNPLVVYKSEASDNYHILLSDIRMRVISGMFTARPNRETAAAVARPTVAASSTRTPASDGKQSGGKRKRKRH